jgi:prolipoprotein diacylglyceryltransferase
MPEVVQIGPLQLQGQLVALLLACVLGFWLIRRVVRQWNRVEMEVPDTDRGAGKGLDDLILNSALIVFFTWRLGSLLTQPSLLWESPMKLLMTAGSRMEIVVGIVLAYIYLTYQVRKHGMAWRVLLDMLAIGAASAMFLYAALTPSFGLPTLLPWGIGVEGTVSRFHPHHAYLAILLVPLLVWQQLWTARSITVLGTGKLLKITLFYGGAAGMVASYFALAEPTALYLTPGQLLNLLMLIIGMNLPILSHTTGRRELMDMSQNDSKTQIQQEQQNQQRDKKPASKEGYDKKLDGPNRPST